MDLDQIIAALKSVGIPTALAGAAGVVVWVLARVIPLVFRPNDKNVFVAHLMAEVKSLRKAVGVQFDKLVACEQSHAICQANNRILEDRVARLEERFDAPQLRLAPPADSDG